MLGAGPPSWFDSDLDHFIESYREHERRVHRLCLAYLKDAAAAEDAAQETFIRAAPRLAGMEEHVAGRYLLLVARNTCIDELRRRSALGAAQARLGWLDQPSDPVIHFEDSETVRAVWECLDERERALFMYRFAGYSYGEISARLGMSGSAVGMALLRARRRVRDLLRGVGGVLAAPAAWCCARPRRSAARARLLRAGRRLPTISGWGGRLLVLLAAAGIGSGVGLAASRAPQASPWETSDGVVIAQGEAHPVVTDLTVSPAYASDHTVLAAGHLSAGCHVASCPTLRVSHDGGRTWTALPAAGFAGGRIVLPPSFPRDARIFAAGVRGLQVSSDGGRSFRIAAGIPGPATVIPAGMGEGARIVIGATPLWAYDLTSGHLDEGPALPPGMIAVDDVRLVDGRSIVVTGARVDRVHPDISERVVVRCSGPSCRQVLAVHAEAPLQLASAPVSTAVVAVSSATTLFVSADGGRSFSVARTRPGRIVATTVELLRNAWSVAALTVSADSSAASLLVVDVAGRVQAVLGMPSILAHVNWLAGRPDGRLIAGLAEPDAAADGLRCSDDGGRLWSACR